MRMKISIICVLTVLILFAGCFRKEIDTSSDIEEETLNEQVISLEEKIKLLEEKEEEFETRYWNLYKNHDSLIKFSKEAVNRLNSDERDKLAREQFAYKIRINGVNVTESEMQIIEREFNIALSEERTTPAMLINELDGGISGDYRNHMKIVGIEPQNITFPDGTEVTAIVYEFEDIPYGTEFEIQVTDELKERIGLSNNIIRVHIGE